MNHDTIESCIEKVHKYIASSDTTSSPYFINVENKDDYISIRECLDPVLNIISVSSYCRSEDSLPDVDTLFSKLRSISKNTLLVGVTQYLKLRGEKQLSQRISSLKSMTTEGGKIIVLCYQTERELQQYLKNDCRLQNRFVFLSETSSMKPHYIFMKSSIVTMESDNTYKGFKEFLKEQEAFCTEYALVLTNINQKMFDNAICSVQTIVEIFDTLAFLDKTLATQLSEKYGTEKQWRYLIEKMELYKDFISVLEKELGITEKFELVFNQWNTFDDNQHWLYWLALRLLCKNDTYLTTVANSSSTVNQFIEKLYVDILDIDCFSSVYKKIYDERKNLLRYVSSPKDDNNFCALAEGKGELKIYYLTDLTEIEKKEIIKCLCVYEYNQKKINGILEYIYPELAKYLLPYNFNLTLLDEYFQDYKYQKLTNRIYPEFLELVNQHAAQREFNYMLPTRMEKFERIDKHNTEVYFFDALGVEFLGYIVKKCNELGMSANVKVCRANLPSITSCNKDFLECIDEPINVKKLDELKHDGEGDYDYRKTPYPIHITKELDIIEDVLKNALTRLSAASKVIIVSDHGASRLAVINKQQYNFDVNSKGTHGGRCCEYTNSVQKVSYATEESGYYVLASYDRFKGSRAASVETHGGASLEEVVVPIIELTIKNDQIIVRFVDSEIFTSYKKKAELMMVSNCKLNDLALKVNGKYYQSDSNDGLKYHFDIADIKKAGNYTAEVFENNNFIANLDFTLKKEGSAEKDLF